jgi:hypothetical protein
MPVAVLTFVQGPTRICRRADDNRSPKGRLSGVKMSACPRCGSIRIRLIKGRLHDWLLGLVLRQDVVVCGRCGWQGRSRRSSGRESRNVRDHAAASAPAGDQTRALDLEALDRDLDISKGEGE